MENQTQDSVWKKIFFQFINNLTGSAFANLKTRLQEAVKEIGKKTFSSIILLVGITFVLIACVILINDLIKESASIGFAIVGLITIIFGFLLGRNR